MTFPTFYVFKACFLMFECSNIMSLNRLQGLYLVWPMTCMDLLRSFSPPVLNRPMFPTGSLKKERSLFPHLCLELTLDLPYERVKSNKA